MKGITRMFLRLVSYLRYEHNWNLR